MAARAIGETARLAQRIQVSRGALIALLALAGAVAVGELLAGAVITVMLASGRALEGWAAGRARRDLSGLLARAPRTARRYRDGSLEEVPLNEIEPGDVVVVAHGDLVPADSTVASGRAILDESALTGEPVPVEHPAGDRVRSGVVNTGGPVDVVVTARAEESTYAAIVRLVAEAERSQAPFVRLADRYAVWFLLVTLAAAGITWVAAGAARAVAVLVVATPCPLILAAPVALVSGMSVAARRGVVVKGGGVLENLARCTTLLMDKTGTLTSGHPALSAIVPTGRWRAEDVLRLAASLDQVSGHVLAGAVVSAATESTGSHGLFAGGRRRAHRRPDRPARRGCLRGPQDQADRDAERAGRDGHVTGGHGRGGRRPAARRLGRLLQEGIDVAVILNALRALQPGRAASRMTAADAALTCRFQGEHEVIRADIEELRATADSLGFTTPDEAMARIRRAYRMLAEEIGPHEQAEERELYPALDRMLGSPEVTTTMSRGHAEIAHQARRLGQLIDDIGSEPPDDADLADLRALLYGLHAILRLAHHPGRRKLPVPGRRGA
jgi:iron-sulfur cluster repair protein YtfE (RIC family)